MNCIINDVYTQYHQRIIIISITILFSSALFADQKPYAPESIQDVATVSAEEVIEIDPEGNVVAGEIGIVTRENLEDYIAQKKG